jgi:cell division protein FtsQ
MRRQGFRRQHRIRRKTSFLKNRYFWLSLFVFVIFGTSSYFLFFADFFQVKEIDVSGNQKITSEDIKKEIDSLLSINFMNISSKSIFLTNFRNINSEILKKFPQLASISFKRDFPNRLTVEAEERKPIAVFCPDLNCYLIDKEGVVFEKVEVIFSDFPRINNIEGKNNFSLGEKIIDKDTLNFILDTKKGLNEKLKITAEEFSLPSSQRLNVKTKEKWEIYFNLKGDLNWQLEKLILVLEKEIPPEKRKYLEYIDLRFTRVYFKYR